MSFDEVIDLVSPSQASLDEVYEYFHEKGISKEDIQLHQSRDFMTVTMTVERAETLFQVFFLSFEFL